MTLRLFDSLLSIAFMEKPSSLTSIRRRSLSHLRAAQVIGLARMIMSQGLPVRLRVMVPAVENAIDGGAFRPGDVLVSRSGKTSEIGNTGE